MVIWFLGFWYVPPLFEDEIFPTRRQAIEQAVLDAGPRWPGTTVHITRDVGSSFVVERRWLGVWEVRVRVERIDSEWEMLPQLDSGPGLAMRIVIGLLAPTVFTYVISRRLWRRYTSRSLTIQG